MTLLIGAPWEGRSFQGMTRVSSVKISDEVGPSLPDTGVPFLGVGSAVIASWSRQGYHQ